MIDVMGLFIVINLDEPAGRVENEREGKAIRCFIGITNSRTIDAPVNLCRPTYCVESSWDR